MDSDSITVKVPETGGWQRPMTFATLAQLRGFIDEVRELAVREYDETSRGVNFEILKEQPQPFYAAREARDVLADDKEFWSLNMGMVHKAATWAAVSDERWQSFQHWVITVVALVDQYQSIRRQKKSSDKAAPVEKSGKPKCDCPGCNPLAETVSKAAFELEATPEEATLLLEKLFLPMAELGMPPPRPDEIKQFFDLVRHDRPKFDKMVARIEQKLRERGEKDDKPKGPDIPGYNPPPDWDGLKH
jgi:hypothetical protein